MDTRVRPGLALALALLLCTAGCALFRAGPAPKSASGEGDEAEVRPLVGGWSDYTKRGREHLRFGELKEAEDDLAIALELSRSFAPTGVRARTALGNLDRVAQAYERSERTEDYARLEELLVEASERILGPDDPATATHLFELGRARLELGETDAALPPLQRALSLRSRVSRSEGPDVAAVREQLGRLYLERDELDLAAQQLERSVEILEQALGESDEAIASPLSALGDVYAEQDRFEDAERAFERVWELYAAAEGEAQPKTLAANARLGRFYADQGRLDQAEEIFQRGVEARTEEAGEDDAVLALLPLNDLASFYVDHGRPAEAEARARRAVEIAKAQGLSGPERAAVLDTLAKTLDALGKYAESESTFLRALEESGARDEDLHTEILETYAALLRKLARDAEAEQLLARIDVEEPNLDETEGAEETEATGEEESEAPR
jgi:tetratricopeptide (TPR) repeat protein